MSKLGAPGNTGSPQRMTRSQSCPLGTTTVSSVLGVSGGKLVSIGGVPAERGCAASPVAAVDDPVAPAAAPARPLEVAPITGPAAAPPGSMFRREMAVVAIS